MTHSQGPGAYFTEVSAFQMQPESDKTNAAVVGFTKARRVAEAKRFISFHHSQHHKLVPPGEPGPGQYSADSPLLQSKHPQMRFGTETRAQRRLKFLSPEHSALDHKRRAYPGPATYNPVRTRMHK